MKLFWKISAALAAVLALLFTVYMLNLDMKLVRGVVLPFLNKHYDRQKLPAPAHQFLQKAAALGRRPGGQQGTQPNGHQPPLHQRGK